MYFIHTHSSIYAAMFLTLGYKYIGHSWVFILICNLADTFQRLTEIFTVYFPPLLIWKRRAIIDMHYRLFVDSLFQYQAVIQISTLSCQFILAIYKQWTINGGNNIVIVWKKSFVSVCAREKWPVTKFNSFNLINVHLINGWKLRSEYRVIFWIFTHFKDFQISK